MMRTELCKEHPAERGDRADGKINPRNNDRAQHTDRDDRRDRSRRMMLAMLFSVRKFGAENESAIHSITVNAMT